MNNKKQQFWASWFQQRKKTSRSSVSFIPGLRNLLKDAQVQALIDCSERVHLVFPSMSALRIFLDTDALYPYLRAERLVLLHDGKINIFLELRETWEDRLSHEWQWLLDQRTLDTSLSFLNEQKDKLSELLENYIVGIEADRSRLRLKTFLDTREPVVLINNLLSVGGIQLEAIAMNPYIILEYRERKAYDDSYFAI